MLKKIFGCLFFFLLFLTPLQKALADDQFSISYDNLYEIGSSPQTKVTQKITLTNLTSQYYIESSLLTISSEKISDITGSDGLGPLKMEIKRVDNKTEIKVYFNQKIAGIGKKLTWTISYLNPEIAWQAGRVWEVMLPAVSDSNLTGFESTLSVPSTFEDAVFISPKPINIIKQGNRRLYLFNQNKVISATFGNYQAFNFTLKYHLINTNLVPIITEVALPPDTSYQDIFYQEISPKPQDVVVDEDGNWLAKYKLLANQKIDVVARGTVKLYPRDKNQQGSSLSDTQRSKYLESQKYWETQNVKIIELAQQLKTPENIYQFVSEKLKYDSSRLNNNKIERLGAVRALQNPENAVCMEYTDLFIALARAAGIPAREINGYAYTTDSKLRPISQRQDILHAWPEYWDDNLKHWVSVDPTWGSTTKGADYFSKFDLNHFAFVIKGLSSQRPYPAGAYKYNDDQNEDVNVTFIQSTAFAQPQIEVGFNLPQIIYSGFPVLGEISVKNSGNVIIPQNHIVLGTGKTDILSPKTLELGALPPFANRTVSVNLKSDGWFVNADDNFVVLVNGEPYVFNYKIRPLTLLKFLPVIGGIIGGIILGSIALALAFRFRRLSFFRFGKQDNLRRQSNKS